jgi:hypothetical protein
LRDAVRGKRRGWKKGGSIVDFEREEGDRGKKGTG